MNFNKLTKYCYRFSKSIKSQNRLKTNEYAEHLKYYIQKGGEDPKKINEQLSKLSDIIKQININPKYNLDAVSKELKTKTDELTNSQEKIRDLTTELDGLKAQLTGDKDVLKSANDKLVDENKTISDKLVDIEKLLAAEKEKNENELNAIKAASLKLQEDILKLLAGDEVTDMPEDIKQKVIDAIAEIKKKEDKTLELSAKANDLEASSKELSELKEQLNTEIKKSSELNDEIEKLKKRIAELEKENTELNDNFIEFDKNKANKLNDLINDLLLSIFGEDIKNEIFGKLSFKSNILPGISSGKDKLKHVDEIPPAKEEKPVTETSSEKEEKPVTETSSEKEATSVNSSEGTDNNIKPPKFKEGDRVKIIDGDYKGKYGKVLEIHTKHQKGNKTKFQYTIQSYTDKSFTTEEEILEKRVSEKSLKPV